MGLADRLAEATMSPHPNAGCTVGNILTSCDDDDADALREALSDRRWRHSDIAVALQGEGHNVTATTVGRHRRGHCKCDEAGLT